MAEELSAEIENIRDEIKAEMLKRNADEVITGEYKITWKTVISNRLDTTALKKTLPDVFERFTKQTESKILYCLKRETLPDNRKGSVLKELL